MPFPFFAVLSAAGSLMQASAAASAAKRQARALENEAVLSKAEAAQRHSDRMLQYEEALGVNIAQFAAQGRDFTSDRSVQAFLNEQQRRVATDISRRDFVGQANFSKQMAAAAAKRSAASGYMLAGILGAAGTIYKAKWDADQTALPAASGGGGK
jgi:hypothetical protein